MATRRGTRRGAMGKRKRMLKRRVKRKATGKLYKRFKTKTRKFPLTVGTHYRKFMGMQDRQHVKFVSESEPEMYQVEAKSGSSFGGNMHGTWNKIRMNSLDAPGYDWSSSASYRLPLPQPTDWKAWGAKYSQYQVTGSKLELKISYDYPGSDNQFYHDFAVCVVPVGYRLTGAGTTYPFTSWQQMISQPYARVYTRRAAAIDNFLYIKRYMRIQKLEGQPAGAADPNFSGGISDVAISSPNYLSHWHVAFRYRKVGDDVAKLVAFTVQAKMTYYTTLYGRRLIPDPGVVT